MAKAPSAAERRHLNRIADMPCIVCGGPANVHHITSTGFARITRTHRLVAPLCAICHQYGAHAIHTIGHAAFCKLHGIDLLKWATLEWEKSNG